MFYETRENKHGLRHDPFKALAVPRPIGWISTVDKNGVCNLAPTASSTPDRRAPALRDVQLGGPQETLRSSIADDRRVRLLTRHLGPAFQHEHDVGAGARGVDEFPIGDLTAAPSRLVKPPRVKESPAAFECKHWQTIDLPGVGPDDKSNYSVVIGRVVGIYIDDRFCQGRHRSTPAPCAPSPASAYMDYAVVHAETVFSIERPSAEEAKAILLWKAPAAHQCFSRHRAAHSHHVILKAATRLSMSRRRRLSAGLWAARRKPRSLIARCELATRMTGGESPPLPPVTPTWFRGMAQTIQDRLVGLLVARFRDRPCRRDS